MNEPLPIEKSKQWPQLLTSIIAAILSVSTGLHFGWPAAAIPKLIDNELQFPVSKHQAAYLTMMDPVGYLIGCPVNSILLDKIGRKFAMFTWAAPQIIAWLLIARSTGIKMLYIARFLAAISAAGVFSSIPVYICEISEPQIRGLLGTIHSVATVMGLLMITCLGSYLTLRTSAYIAILVPLLFMVSVMWMPQSPYHCIMNGNIEAARNSLKQLRKSKNVEKELTELMADIGRQTSEPSNLLDVFTIRSNLKALLIVTGLRTVQQLTGGAALQFYAQIIFKEAGVDYIASSIVLCAAFVIVAGCATLVVDRAGRKPLLIISLVGSAICLFTIAVYFFLRGRKYDVSSIKWLPLTGMILFTFCRGCGLLTIPALMTGELFSASIKAKAVGIATFHFSICVCLSSKAFAWLSEFSMHVPFFFFFVCSCIGIIFVYFCVPETNGKTLEEIQQHLKGLQ